MTKVVFETEELENMIRIEALLQALGYVPIPVVSDQGQLEAWVRHVMTTRRKLSGWEMELVAVLVFEGLDLEGARAKLEWGEGTARSIWMGLARTLDVTSVDELRELVGGLTA